MMSLDRQEEPVDSDGRGPLSQDMINLIDEHSLMVSVSPSANAQTRHAREGGAVPVEMWLSADIPVGRRAQCPSIFLLPLAY